MESIQVFVIINLFVIGLSHLLQPIIWVDFFQFLSSKGNVGNTINGMLTLGMGAFIISFHCVFTWPMIIITIYGILLCLKGLIYLTLPSIGLKSIKMIDSSCIKFRWVGLIMVMLSFFLMKQMNFNI
jgi:hypothetical protein